LAASAKLFLVTLRMTFKASLGLTAIIVTTVVTILFAILIGGQYAIIKDAGRALPIYTTTACVLIYLIAYAFRPVSYVVTQNEILVKRPLFDVHINTTDIASAEIIDRRKLHISIRTMGIPGIFGFSGTFYNLTYGRMTWYVTRRDRPVLIRTKNDKKIVLTPNEPEKFIQQLNN
jgi:hypothetical protein